MALTNLKINHQVHNAPRPHLKDLTPSLRLNYVIDKFPLSREKLAQLLGVSPRTVNRWVKSDVGPERREHIEQRKNMKVMIAGEEQELSEASKYMLDMLIKNPNKE
mgnify:CR=1 FL=1